MFYVYSGPVHTVFTFGFCKYITFHSADAFIQSDWSNGGLFDIIFLTKV